MQHQASCCLLYELACREDTVHLLKKHSTAVSYWLTYDTDNVKQPRGLWDNSISNIVIALDVDRLLQSTTYYAEPSRRMKSQ